MPLLRPWILFSLLAVALSMGCSGDDTGSGGGGGEGVEPDPAADACEHLEGGPFADVEAIPDADDAPDVSGEHTAYHVTLPGDEASGYGGYVTYVLHEGSEVVFFTDQDATLALQDANGEGIAWEDACTSDCTDACTTVRTSWTVDIPTVGTYALHVESSAEEVTVVILHAGDHDHGHD